eukprot:3111375-Rhodomonas_salina.1
MMGVLSINPPCGAQPLCVTQLNYHVLNNTGSRTHRAAASEVPRIGVLLKALLGELVAVHGELEHVVRLAHDLLTRPAPASARGSLVSATLLRAL